MTQQTGNLAHAASVIGSSLRFAEMIKMAEIITKAAAREFAEVVARSIHKFARTDETFFVHHLADQRARKRLDVSFKLQLIDQKSINVELLHRVSISGLMSELVPECKETTLGLFAAEFWKTMEEYQMAPPSGQQDKLISATESRNLSFQVNLIVADTVADHQPPKEGWVTRITALESEDLKTAAELMSEETVREINSKDFGLSRKTVSEVANIITPGSTWLHISSNTEYVVFDVTNLVSNIPGFCPTVVYRHNTAPRWSRPVKEFIKKFKKVSN